jgi:hypothetical protein
VTHDVLIALDRLEDYLQRVRASVIRQDVYHSMNDSAELAEIARRLYRSFPSLVGLAQLENSNG